MSADPTPTPPPPLNPVAKAASLAWKPPDARPPWQWAEDNYTPPVSAIPGRWKSENSPWVKRLTECFADNAIKQITALCSAQSAKTETALLLLNWIIAEDPSPTIWVAASDEEGLKFANERLMPSMRLCPPVAKQIPDDRTLAKSMEILFPTMAMEIVGANSKAKLQSRVRRFLLLDEVRNWPDWALPMVLKRARTWWNRRVLILTTPGTAHDTVHQNFLEGSQEYYHVPCLNPDGCDYRGPLEFENLKAAHPTEKDAEGRPLCVKWSEVPDAITDAGKWDLNVLSPQLRYVCPKCGHLHADLPQVRRRLAIEGGWVAHNPKAPAHLVSFTWSAMLSPWVKWKEVVEEFLLAQNALEFGNFEPFKAFWTETLGRPWEDRLRFAKTEGYIDDRVMDADAAVTPLPNATRVMMVDVQGKGGRHFYWAVFDFAPGGAHRAVAWGKAWSIEELRAAQVDHQVPSAFVGIDTGHWATEVYGYIMESGVLPNGEYAWKAMKGDRAQFYRINLGDGQTLRLPYNWSFVDPFLGKSQAGRVRPIKQLLFSKPSMLDRAEACMRGHGQTFEIPPDGDMLHEFKQQLTAYERSEKTKTTGEVEVEWIQKRPDDHWGSCFDPETDVLTRDGWIPWPKVKGSEKFATVDLATDRIEYQESSHLTRKHHEGHLLECVHRGLSFAVTPDHRMVVEERYHYRDEFGTLRQGHREKVKPARELTLWDRIKLTASSWVGEDGDYVVPATPTHPEVAIDRALLARFLGWFTSEGYCYRRPDGSCQIDIAQKGGSVRDGILTEETLSRLPWKFSRNKRATIHYAGNRQIRDLVEECGHLAENKRVPQWVKDSSPRVISAFLAGLFLGDGHLGKKRLLSTTSKQLADDVAELLLKIGLTSRTVSMPAGTWSIRGRSGVSLPHYRVTVRNIPHALLRDSKNKFLVKETPYSGTVYCATVPNGTLIVRRHGTVMIAGNCYRMALAAAISMGLMDVPGSVIKS